MAHLWSQQQRQSWAQQQPADYSGAKAGPRRQKHQWWVLGPKNPRCRRPPAMRPRLLPPSALCPLAGLASEAPDSGGRTSRDESECRCRRELCGRTLACVGDMQGSSRACARLCLVALPGRPSPEAAHQWQRPEIRTWGRDASEMGATVWRNWPKLNAPAPSSRGLRPKKLEEIRLKVKILRIRRTRQCLTKNWRSHHWTWQRENQLEAFPTELIAPPTGLG